MLGYFDYTPEMRGADFGYGSIKSIQNNQILSMILRVVHLYRCHMCLELAAAQPAAVFSAASRYRARFASTAVYKFK